MNDQTTAPQDDNQTTQPTIEQLQAELIEMTQKFDQMTNLAKQALADLQNFRRRTEEDQKNSIVYANLDLLKDLLPAIDNCNRALAHEPKDTTWSEGVTNSLKQMWQILERRKVTIIPTIGTKLDPLKHEALLVGPGEHDIITAELEKGYMLGERVIKPARVQVGNGEVAPSPAT